MATREIHRIHCREHGGYFDRPAQRGRPPVRCSVDNPCDAAQVRTSKVPNSRITRTVAEPKQRGPKLDPVQRAARGISNLADAKRVAKSTPRSRVEHAAQEPGHNGIATKPREPREAVRQQRRAVGKDATREATLAKAQSMKDQLQEQGWTVSGKGSIVDDVFTAYVSASRGEEMINAIFANGKLDQPMQYSLWSTDKPSKNGKPQPTSRLSFDPNEIPDYELVEKLKGVKVTWWNRLGSMDESAIVSADKVTIEHIFNGHGDEHPGERIVKFIEHGGSGFRAFRLDALLKVG